NYSLDLWRGFVHVAVPLSIVVALLLMAGGMPMTLDGNASATTVQAGAMGTETVDGKDVSKPQSIARGPVAAIVAIKQLRTNSCPPFENPTSWTNVVECVSIILIPMACLVMFGRMIRDMRQAVVIYVLSLVALGTFAAWAIYHDTLHPNPALGAQPEQRLKVD